MVLAADIITNKKLAIVRQVYAEAARQRAKGTAIGRLLAVVGYDLAVETALKAAVRALDAGAPLKSDMGELVATATTALAKHSLGPVPRAASVRHLRNLRNAAQHEGRLPTSLEEDECHAIGQGFLDDLLSLVWGSRLDAVSVSALVADEIAKTRLEEAELSYSGGDHVDAIAKASEALAWALQRVKHSLVGSGDTWARAVLTQDAFGRPRASSDLTRSIERTQTTVLYLALGMDYGEYVRYSAVAGTVTFMAAGPPHHWGAKPEPDVDDVQYVLAYVSECLVQIESRAGSIEKPFGREGWY